VAEITRKAGYEMIKYPLPPEEVERWTKVASVPLWKEWVKRMEGKGYTDG